MKIGIISESSSCDKNSAIEQSLQRHGHEIINIGMKSASDTVTLNYLHASFMAALLLHTKAVDFMVGGCGTGQGFAIGCNQFPGVFCGHIVTPLDAWLFIQINNGNAISLELNKGYGWAGDKNLDFIFDALFSVQGGSGYPEHRREVQKEARAGLSAVSMATHLSFEKLILLMDRKLLVQCAKNEIFLKSIESAPANAPAKDAFLKIIS